MLYLKENSVKVDYRKISMVDLDAGQVKPPYGFFGLKADIAQSFNITQHGSWFLDKLSTNLSE